MPTNESLTHSMVYKSYDTAQFWLGKVHICLRGGVYLQNHVALVIDN